MAVDTSPRGLERKETSDGPNITPGSPSRNNDIRRASMGTNGLKEAHAIAPHDSLHTGSPVYQLPSPSPSSRNTSPSLESTVSSSHDTEVDISSSSVNIHMRSDVSEQDYAVDRNIRVLDGTLGSPKPISKEMLSHELEAIPEDAPRKSRKPSLSRAGAEERVLKLSSSAMEELISAPESLPIPLSSSIPPNSISPTEDSSSGQRTGRQQFEPLAPSPALQRKYSRTELSLSDTNDNSVSYRRVVSPAGHRPGYASRATSTPVSSRPDLAWANSTSRQLSPHRRAPNGTRPEPLDLSSIKSSGPSTNLRSGAAQEPPTTPPQAIPLPPMSIPIYLQLELASSRPSPLYIHPSSTSDYPYESSRIKFERLLNVLILPPQLEICLLFGSLACLDAWLSTFTILPLRFVKACAILIRWWGQVLAREARFVSGFIYHGSGRMWHRRQRGRSASIESTARSRSVSRSSRGPISANQSYASRVPEGANGSINPEKLRAGLERKSRSTWGRKHRRTKSQPSTLSSYHKADLLQGLVIICSSMILMTLDASRMYHSVRGQSAMKLYVLYNLIEVADRLFSALGQDIFECLTSDETIQRGADGRSKLLRPFGMFILALVYNVIHASALLYQVITLNVAVNSYSNALITLLMSNQFVEVKSTVFKKFEKENLFQLTCADVVERFQLWLMLVIIGMRNIVEVGGLTVPSSLPAAADSFRNATVPLRSSSILPNSFTILPHWTGEVLSPFLIVLGSELLVDWVKHAYIGKFNNIAPALYQKFTDVLAKDYYTNAFVNQNLIKRLGLPVIPLSCLFIRASIQTYHMFLATNLPTPIPSAATALSAESAATSSPTAAALEHFDNIIRKALGRSTFGTTVDGTPTNWYQIGTDDIIAFITMLVFFLGVFLVLLACKLVLGMVLLNYAGKRYRSMKKREHLVIDTKGKRLGGWGTVEVDDEKRKWIYEDDPDGAKALKDRGRKAEAKAREAAEKGVDFGKVARYDMVAKRIW